MVNLPASATILLGVILSLYLVGLLVLSIVATKKVANEEDYLVAGRRLSLFLTWGTLIATWFGAASMMGAAENARNEGLLGVVLDPFACSLTLILAGFFFVRPLWRMKLLTIGDFFRQKYGPKSEITACCIQVPSYFGWIAAQFIALASVQHVYFDIDMRTAVWIAAAITLSYTMIGGMWSVTLTDTLQIVIAFSGLLILIWSAFSHAGGGDVSAGVERFFNEVPATHFNMLPGWEALAFMTWLGTWATGLLGNLPGQDLNQRAFSARSEQTAMWACILAGVAYLVFGMIPVTLGLLSNVTDPGEIHGNILPVMAGKYLTPTLAVIFVVSIVSIVMSTATSAVLAPATILSHNLLGRVRVLQGHNLLLDRSCVCLVALGGVAMTYMGQSILDLLDFQLSFGLTALFIPLLMGLYGKPRGEMSGWLPMLLGGGTWFTRYAFETFLYAMPEAVAGTTSFPDYIAGQLSIEQVGSLLHWLAYGFAFIPADLIGLGASIVGYWIGQSYYALRGTDH